MDLGSEISKQIKSAIKNKLQELGSYVDDELPEYILVMLSNKRGKKQMTEDLMLFLGENTAKFIDWLTNLIEKLKDVASLVDSPQESNEVSNQHDIPDITPEKEALPIKNDGKKQVSEKSGSTRDKRKSPTTRDNHHPKSSKSVSSRSERTKGISSSKQTTSESKHSSNKKRKLSESDEEYQVSTPLSSVVRVQEKRPTLPPSKQATSSLLRKAVAEAHMSVAVNKVMHSLTYDPTSPPSPKKVQSLEEKKQQKEILLQQHRELQKQLQTKELEDSGSNQEQTESDNYEPKERENTENEQTTQEKVKMDSDIINEPVIELQVSEAEAEELNAELAQGDMRIVAFADSQPSSTTEEDKHKRKRKRAVKSRDRPRSPKFIVTLDGVDSELEDKFEKRSKPKPKSQKSQSEFDDYVEIDTSNMSFAPQSEIIVAEDKPTPPAVEEVMFTLDMASDDEDGQQMADVSQPQEKCKFWPDCMNGPNCPYYHPSTPCRTFPNCKFADKCLFIHPLCKFDGRCGNMLCPFLHKNRPKVKPPPVIKPKPLFTAPVLQVDEALPVLAQITPCKFFPGCTRSNCPFLHPKPTITKVCRYGSTCSRVDCMFTHPPSKAALKWVAPSTHISERSFAIPEDKVTKTPIAS